MKIAVVFPVFNGLKYTRNCLATLFERFTAVDSREAEFKVVVVDDGSTDGTSEFIKDQYPEVVLLQGDGNLWWSGGMNLGIEHAIAVLKADFLVWWNNDIIPADDYFIRLTERLKAIPQKTIYGSKIYMDSNFDTVWSMGGIFDVRSGYKEMIGSGMPDGSEFQKPRQCQWLTGMGTITPVAVYNEIGLLDEKRFPQYHGDADFTLRAWKAGYTIEALPDLKIYNDTRNSGLRHNDSWKGLWDSLFSIRSNFNIRKDFMFYRKHIETPVAYKVVINKYFRYIGGFIKWKILSLIGKERNIT
ncbi:MAG: hypothetical protein Kow00127_01650 [Bacteroidales bacterium]